MTQPLPENVRQAGYDALEELSTRMSRGATNLSKQAMRLRLDDPKSQREALCQLRRYQNFEMPGFGQVAIIVGALMGLTEPESKALAERQYMEKNRKERAEERAHNERVEEEWRQGGWPVQEAVRKALSRAKMLVEAASHIEKNPASVEIKKALVLCMDAWWPGGDPYSALSHKLHQTDNVAEEAVQLPQGGNVLAGPWGAAGEVRP